MAFFILKRTRRIEKGRLDGKLWNRFCNTMIRYYQSQALFFLMVRLQFSSSWLSIIVNCIFWTWKDLSSDSCPLKFFPRDKIFSSTVYRPSLFLHAWLVLRTCLLIWNACKKREILVYRPAICRIKRSRIYVSFGEKFEVWKRVTIRLERRSQNSTVLWRASGSCDRHLA